MTHITCRLTAKNRDQLRNPTTLHSVIEYRLSLFLFYLAVSCLYRFDFAQMLTHIVSLIALALLVWHLTTLVFTGRMTFLLPNQQRQSTEGRRLTEITSQCYLL